jgi:serine/threonine protein kinase
MDRQRCDQIEELFHAAAQLAPGERDSFVAVRCGEDTELRQEVMALLEQTTLGLRPIELMLERRLHDEIRLPLNAGTLLPGTTVGPYLIEGPLGRGGMGDVYRARDIRLGRSVALKFLSGAMAANQAFLDRFQREAQAISTLNHPNVCTVYDIGDQAGRPYFVMELLEGQTLKDRIAEGVLSNEQLFEVMIPILDALEAAHAAQIVHRDIKPANIFITQRGVVKILDFGIAKSTGVEGGPAAAMVENLTAPGITVGTISYMSPEQARGLTVDARTDLFACGVVLYQMATGMLPFAGDGWVTSLEALLSGTPRAPRELRRDLLPGVERVIDRALEKELRTRYQSAADMRAELIRAKRSLEPQSAPPLMPASRPGSWKARGAGVAALAMAGFAGWYFDIRKHPVTSPSEYVQITDFSDSASAPSLSSDGRMVTFLRGGSFFLTTGQVYVKLLPDGQSTQITSDPHEKYNPVFMPDGSRVAYTVLNREENSWDTWTVPVTGGAPAMLMRNAAGMSWIGHGRILFSELMSGAQFHMGIVTSQESRTGERRIYLPEHVRAMAHYSYVSPDQKSLLSVEMDPTWLPCRLVPVEKGSQGRQVGPQGPCTAAAWSPDGKWMYFTAETNGANHLWRQRFPSGTPEQITAGPGEEQGLAVAPDGKSLISSVGVRKSSVWMHDATGEHLLSPEGSATYPQFSGDSKHVYYMLRKKASGANELWSTDVPSGSAISVLPGVPLVDFDISRDGQRVAFTAPNDSTFDVFIAPLDRSAPPRLVTRGGEMARFIGGTDELIFRQLGGHTSYLARVRTDGTGLGRVLDVPVSGMNFVSPDGNWVGVIPGESEHGTFALSLKDGTRKLICLEFCSPRWSDDGAYLYVTMNPAPQQANPTLVFPIPPGAGLPVLPAKGLAPQAGAEVPGITVIRQDWPGPGPSPQTYTYVKSEFAGNLFRVPLH